MISRLQHSFEVGLFEFFEPDEFLPLRGFEPPGDLGEIGGNDSLSVRREWESLAKVNPEAMRRQNVMNELA